MAFDFENNIGDEHVVELEFDYNKVYNPLINTINSEYLKIRNNPRYDKLNFAVMRQTPHNALYIDCYKSNWDRYKDPSYYNIFWNTIFSKKYFDKANIIKWKLSPYLNQLRFFDNDLHNNSVFWRFIKASRDKYVRYYYLNIPEIKKAMEIMYGHSVLYKSNYVHSITIDIAYSGAIVFTNPKSELIEFKNWLKERIKSKEWMINPKDFLFTDITYPKKIKNTMFWCALENAINKS